jgi:hypothetical protein
VSGVGQDANAACRTKSRGFFPSPPLFRRARTVGVCHPVQPLSAVRRSDARSAQIGSPAGISQFFQVSANSSEPLSPIRARNLLSKDDCRTALGDEIVKSGPKVALVGVALALARARKRLTGTGACPDAGDAFESGPAQGEGPAADPGEEVALVVLGEFIGLYLQNAAAVHVASRQLASRDQLAEPGAGARVVVVVVGDYHLRHGRAWTRVAALSPSVLAV